MEFMSHDATMLLLWSHTWCKGSLGSSGWIVPSTNLSLFLPTRAMSIARFHEFQFSKLRYENKTRTISIIDDVRIIWIIHGRKLEWLKNFRDERWREEKRGRRLQNWHFWCHIKFWRKLYYSLKIELIHYRIGYICTEVSPLHSQRSTNFSNKL